MLLNSSALRTEKVCLPFLTFAFSGDVQGTNSALSSEHSKRATARSGSVPVKSKVALFFPVFFGGPFVIVVSGGSQSSRRLV